MSRIQGDLLERTYRFARAVIQVAGRMPNGPIGWELGRQLVRSGAGVGANLREAHNAMTDAEFARFCSIARREASEAGYWLELTRDSDLTEKGACDELLGEADELARILSAVVRKTQRHIRQERTAGRRSPTARNERRTIAGQAPGESEH